MIEVSFLQFTPLIAITCAIAMVVLRAGASRVFFDIVGTYQASKMIKEADKATTVLEALHLDAITGIQEAATELSDVMVGLIDEVVPISREIEEARIQFDKFLDVAEQTEDTFANIADTGLAFGFAANEAYDAAARMAQLSGVLGAGTTGVGTELGMVFGLISGMETEDAMQRMINLNQQTGFMTEGIEENANAELKRQMIYRNSMTVLDQLNTIENRSAATMQQITFVMNQFASQAELTGESIAAMAAMSATLIEAGEEQGKGGRALKMIYARLGANTAGAADAVRDLGIQLENADGTMKPFSDILDELAEKYQYMTGVERQALAQSIAGNRHYTRLIKLLENVDRVRELEREGLEGMFPAMDEANRRRETELFALEQSEARLKNYRAALGDEMLPVLKEVTDIQTIFTDTLVQLFDKVPMFMRGVAGLALGFRSFVGPVLTTIISLQNMRIAMDTHKAIQASLTDVVLSGEHAYKNQMGQVVQNTTYMKLYNAALRDVRAIKRTMMTEEQQRLTGIHQNIAREEMILQNQLKQLPVMEELRQKYEEVWKGKINFTTTTKAYIEGLELENEEIREMLHYYRVLEQRIERIAYHKTKMFMEDAAKEAEELERLHSQTQMYNNLSYSLAAVGSGFMLLGRSEKQQRAGMILNTMAMGAQLVKMGMKQKANIIEYAQKTANTLAEAHATAATNVNTGATSTNTAAKELNAMATLQLWIYTNALTLGLSASAAALLAVAAPLALIAGGAYLLARAFAKSTSAVDDFNVSMADFNEAAQLSADLTLPELNDELQTQIGILEELDGATGSLAQTQIDAATKSRDTYQQAIAMEVAGQGNLVELFNERIRLEKDLEQKRAGSIAAQGKGGSAQRFMEAQAALDNFMSDNQYVFDFFEENSLDTIVEIENFASRTAASVSTTLTDTMRETTSVMEQGKEELFEFNNAREELFYGFSSDRLTGDLVRQVHQQGVETLIASTEVIMTNNFNGMTVPEVAEQIMDELESQGRLRGFNLSTV